MSRDFSTESIKSGVKTSLIGREIIYYSSLSSTNDTAREKARDGAPGGTVIIAGEQTAGRGRLKRSWLSPKGNIALSILLRPDTESLPYLIMIASLAVTRSIESVTGLQAQIKWPNDILISGKKVCGILIENDLKGNEVEFAIIGIGINIGLNVAAHEEIAKTAASIQTKTNEILRHKLIEALLTEFDGLYQLIPGGKLIYNEWKKKLITLGKRVKATWGAQVIEGIAESVDESGALYIRDDTGDLIKVVAGDVTLRG